MTYYRHFHCVEDVYRLPGQPIPQPSSGKWPYEDATKVSLWPAEGKNHSQLFIVSCSHPSYPEIDGGLGPRNGPMCFSRFHLGLMAARSSAGLGAVAEWFDEPCPGCNGVAPDHRATQTSPVRTWDPTSFEPTDWHGVSLREQRIIQRYADRLADLCAHALGSAYPSGQREEEPVVVDPYWDPDRDSTPAHVSFMRLQVALRELTCPADATHRPIYLPLMVSQTLDPWRGPEDAGGRCPCVLGGCGQYMLPATFNAAVNSRRQLAVMMMVTIDQNCALERWRAEDYHTVTHAAQVFKDSAGSATVPLAHHVQIGGLAPHTSVLVHGRPMDEATTSARRRNLALFAEELRANLPLQNVSDIHRNSHWEDLLGRLLAEDSGITLRWARMILWRVLADYWKAAQCFDTSQPVSIQLFRSPSHQLALLSETWAANLVAAEGAWSEEYISGLFAMFIAKRAFHKVPEAIAREVQLSRRVYSSFGPLGATARATTDQLLAMIGGDEADCGICREPFAEHAVKLPRQPAPCLAAGANHWFGHACLVEWLVSSAAGRATCPMCRRTIDKVSLPQGTSNMQEDEDSELDQYFWGLYFQYQRDFWVPDRLYGYLDYLRDVSAYR